MSNSPNPSGAESTANSTTGGSGGGSRWAEGAILSLVAGWLVTNFVIQPVGYTLAVFEFYANKVLSMFLSGLQGALGTAGSTIASELEGVRSDVFDAVGQTVADAGLAAPFTVATVTTALIVVVTGAVAVIVLYVLDYIPGGSLVS